MLLGCRGVGLGGRRWEMQAKGLGFGAEAGNRERDGVRNWEL